ncbi:DUF732 domain-containing protein [Rhodococcus yananensis]|uniref:DUF732 domain-containing protein n=1 Tax=Rhodococcus yananensis TaxID=2879464 RepID=UPI003EBDCAE7
MPARTRSRSTRVLGALVAAVASAAVLAACGSDDSTATSTPSATTTTSASATGSATAGAGEETTDDTTTDATSPGEPGAGDAPVTSPGEAATAPPQESVPAVDDRGATFLSALREEGVEPYDDATAISIAEYVCNAQAQGGPDSDVKTMVTALIGSSSVASGAEISEEEAAAAADTYISVAGASYCS